MIWKEVIVLWLTVAAVSVSADESRGICWAEILDDGQCSVNIGSNLMTEAECCGTIGEAWGPSCTICNAELPIGEDIDECEYDPNLCANGDCINTPGSYICECNEGFVLDTSGHDCVDIDECAHEVCGENSDCTNDFGGYTCTCHEGYTGYYGSDCVPVPVPVHPCDSNPCGNHGTCYIQPNGVDYGCVCAHGYLGDHCQEDRRHPCNSGQHNCDENAECHQRDADEYSCSCMPGFRGDGYVCEDIDECAILILCGNGQCVNTPGSFRCECNFGFVIDESGNQCVSAGFTLSCEDGYILTDDGTTCIRDGSHPCVTGSHNCGENAECIAREGNWYSCGCRTGYYFSPDGDCEDVDECATSCLTNAECVNVPGSFYCHCNEGYYMGPTGHECIQDESRGICWAEILTDGQCSGRLGSNLMTESECCGTIGEAWGPSCTICILSNGNEPKANSGGDLLAEDDWKTLFSPNYPNNYPNNADVTWSIKNENDGDILLDFLEFNTEQNYDRLIIDSLTRNDEYTGRNIRATIYMRSPITLHFTSDHSVTDTGFQIRFKASQSSSRTNIHHELSDICVTSKPCGDNGECIMVAPVEVYECVCNEGWSGLHCDQRLGHICDDANPCQNGATCDRPQDDPPYDMYTCWCAEGWTGENCELQINRHICDDANPCQNGAECFRPEDNPPYDMYHCFCREGWAGLHCDEPMGDD